MSDKPTAPAITADIQSKDLKELAASTGLTQKRLKEISSGNRFTAEEAVKLAPAFDTKPEKLLTRQVKDELKGIVTVAVPGKTLVEKVKSIGKKTEAEPKQDTKTTKSPAKPSKVVKSHASGTL